MKESAPAAHMAAALLAADQGIPVGPPRSRVHLGQGCWLTLRASRISPSDGGESDIAVSLEASTPSERLDMFARSHGLSRRERQVLIDLATGADTHTLAQRLFLSEHTVNDHVKAVLGARSDPRSFLGRRRCVLLGWIVQIHTAATRAICRLSGSTRESRAELRRKSARSSDWTDRMSERDFARTGAH